MTDKWSHQPDWLLVHQTRDLSLHTAAHRGDAIFITYITSSQQQRFTYVSCRLGQLQLIKEDGGSC